MPRRSCQARKLRGLPPLILMMKPTQSRKGKHSVRFWRFLLNVPTYRHIPIQRKMATIMIILFNVLGEKPSQMLFAEDEDMIEKLSSNWKNTSFWNSVLPRCSIWNYHGFYSHGLDEFFDLSREDAVPVKDEILGEWIELESLSQLLFHPLCCGVLRNIDMHNLSSRMINYEEDVEDAEADGRHHQEVHGWICVTVIFRECAPGLLFLFVWMFRSEFSEISWNRSLFHIVISKHE